MRVGGSSRPLRFSCSAVVLLITRTTILTLIISGSLSFSIGTFEKMRLDSSGRLLVGTTTTSADTRAVIQAEALQLMRPLHFSGNNSPGNGDGIAELYFSGVLISLVQKLVHSEMEVLGLLARLCQDVLCFLQPLTEVHRQLSGCVSTTLGMYVGGIFGTDTKAVRLGLSGGLTQGNDDAGTYLAQAFQGGNSPSNRTCAFHGWLCHVC